MSKTPKRSCPSQARCRRGAVGMMIVLFLTLLVGTFALTVTRQAYDERRSEHQRRGVAILDSAVKSVHESGPWETGTFDLPVDESANLLIRVEVLGKTDPSTSSGANSAGATRYRATMIRRDQPGLSILRVHPSSD